MSTSAVDEAAARRKLPSPAMRRAIRENVHVSQRRLGQDLGVTGTAIANWESGRREPRGELLVRYAELLGALAEVSR